MNVCRIRVRGYELDSYGHVNNAVFFNYFEQARWEFFQVHGLLTAIKAGGLLLVVTEANIRYQHELKLGDEVEITTNIKKEAPFLVFDQRMKHTPAGFPVARARVKAVFVDSERISHDIPESIGAVLKQ
jgi:YbgC/YbaW family acyl-CoA thioester hydrolase